MDPRPPLTPSAFLSPSLLLASQVAHRLAFALALPSAWNFFPTFFLCPNPSQSSKAQLGNHLLQEVSPTPLPLLSAPCPGPGLSAVGPKLSQKSLPPPLCPHRCPGSSLSMLNPLPRGPMALSTTQALVPLCLWAWGLTFLLLCGALQHAGAEAAATPGRDAEQGPWRYRPEGGASRNGAGGQDGEPRPRVMVRVRQWDPRTSQWA